MEEQEHHEFTPCYSKSFGRSLSIVADLAAPPIQPCSSYPLNNNPQDYFNFYPVSAPPLAHHNQVNRLSAISPTQNHPLAVPQLQLYQTQLLNPEHHYLYLSLSRENMKALSLRQKIAVAEDSLASMELNDPVADEISTPLSITSNTSRISTAPTRRKVKKQVSWLRCRVRECVRQEGIILERLRQMGFEEQRRCQWMQIERQRRINEDMLEWQRGYWEFCAGAGIGYDYGYGYPCNQIQSGLKAGTPAFQPSSLSVGGENSIIGSGKNTAEVKQRKYSNDFWNTEAPVFSLVNFRASGSGSRPKRDGRGSVGSGGRSWGSICEEEEDAKERRGERLSRGWDDCELSPLAEEKGGRWERQEDLKVGIGMQKGEGLKGKEKAVEEERVRETEGDSPGEGSAEGFGDGDSSAETALPTPTPQQSARMKPMGGAKSCNDVKLCFESTRWGLGSADNSEEGGGEDKRGGGKGGDENGGEVEIRERERERERIEEKKRNSLRVGEVENGLRGRGRGRGR